MFPQLHAQSYNLQKPDEKWYLPDELMEVSGLHSFGSMIAMVQDEAGILYLYDPEKAKIYKKIEFREKGDFEGVTIHHNTAYCVRSNGKISVLNNFNTDSMEVTTIKTALNSDNDVEGLTYMSDNSLLLACKEDAGLGSKISKTKAIYRYDLNENKLDDEPFIKITDDAIVAFRKQQSFSFIQRIYNWFNDEFYSFKPSGIAIHPLSGQVYVLAHKGKKIIVCDQKGIKDILDLPAHECPQAEGITFDAFGNLYLSNEGEVGIPATLMKFEVKQ